MKPQKTTWILLLLTAALLLGLAACGSTGKDSAASTAVQTQSDTDRTAEPAPQSSTSAPETAEAKPAPETTPETTEAESATEAVPETAEAEPVPETAAPEPGPETAATEPAPARKDTLVVYFSATGTTKGVAETIAAITDADLYEIQAAEPYTADDLNWNDRGSRTTKEQNDRAARPEIGSAPISLEGYTTVYVGYPIWWGEEPRILDTFVERCDFTGITVIPFCTSSSSGIGRSGRNLAENAGSGSWLEGKRFGAGASEAELRDWIDSLG